MCNHHYRQWDLPYIVKVISGSDLPERRETFCGQLSQYFPNETLDLKFALMKGYVKDLVSFCAKLKAKRAIDSFKSYSSKH